MRKGYKQHKCKTSTCANKTAGDYCTNCINAVLAGLRLKKGIN